MTGGEESLAEVNTEIRIFQVDFLYIVSHDATKNKLTKPQKILILQCKEKPSHERKIELVTKYKKVENLMCKAKRLNENLGIGLDKCL